MRVLTVFMGLILAPPDFILKGDDVAMASLTETAYYTRKSINWAILAVILYLILRLFWSVFVALWLYFFPPKPPPPNHRFGKLSALKFPQPKTPPTGQLTFQLETISGSVPRASESAYVFFMPKAAANLLGLTNTQQFASQLELNPNPIQETKNLYRFEDGTTKLRSLRYDIISNNFILKYNFEQDTGLFNEKDIMNEREAIVRSTEQLTTLRLYKDDFARGRSKVTFLRLVSDTLVPTTSLSQADGVRVDFFRRGVAGMNVYTPYPDEGQVNMIYSGSRNSKKRLLEFVYTYWPVDYQEYATYSLKTSLQAWQELQSGGGYIARYPNTGATTATIRQVSLGYYDSYEPQNYLQPIFVFEGDNGFMAYVPAIASEWVESSTTPTQ